MIFKNAFHLLVDNFKLNYKMLLYKLVAAVITLALGAALLYPTLNALVTSAPFRELTDLLGSFFKAVVSGNTEFLSTFSETLQGKVSALLAFLQENTPNIVLFFVLFAVVVLVHRFLDGIGNFVFGCLLDDKMSSCADTRFFGSYISNLGKAALWQVIYVPVTFLYDMITIAVCYVFFLVMLSIISAAIVASFAALMLSVALILAAQALKLTLLNDVAPALVSDKMHLGAALKRGFSYEKKRFGGLFSTYFITCVLILCINVLCGVASFGAALLITVPMSYLMLTSVQYVSYYTHGKKKYFLAEDNIVLPKGERTDENFYDDFEV